MATTTTGTPLWNAGSLDDQLMADTTAAFGAGAIYYASGVYGTIQALDFQQGTPLWSNFPNGQPSGALQSPVYTTLGAPAGAVYVADDAGNLYSLNLQDGSVLWSVLVSDNAPNGLSNPVIAPNYSGGPAGGPPSAIYVTDSSSVYCIQAVGSEASVQTIYTSPTAINPVATPIFDPATGQLYILEGNLPVEGGIAQNLVTALDLTDGSSVHYNWSVLCDAAGPLAPLALYGGCIYVCDSANAMHILATADGSSVNTSEPMSGPIENAPAAMSYTQPGGTVQTLVFISSTDNFLYCLDGTTAEILWSTQPMGSDSSDDLTQPVIDNGLVYVGGTSTVYAYSPASGDASAAYDTGDTIVGIAGVSNGNVYVAVTNNVVMAVNLWSVINAFQVECELIQDFDVSTPGGGAGAVTQIPVFHCHVTLFNTDANGNLSPLSGETVQISASDTVEITGNSTQVATIGPATTANLVSDGNGKLVITIPANPVASAAPAGSNQPSSCLSCPMLTLWGNFMGQQERIVVYPDQPLHDRMSSITGTTLQNATPYPSSAGGTAAPALPAQYQGASGVNSANQLAEAIRNTIGQTAQSIASVGLTTTSPFIAPNKMISSGVGYSATPPSGSTRSAAAGTQFAIIGVSGGATFTASDQSSVTNYWNGVLKGLGTADSLWGDLEDFVGDVVNDADKVAHVVSYAIQTVGTDITVFISAVVNDVNQAYQCAVNFVQDAVNVIAGVLKSIVGDIEDVIELLSVLFSWGDIVNTMNAFAASVTSALQSLASDMGTLGTDVAGFFATLGTDVEKAFGSVSIGSQSMGAQNQDPSTAYSQGGGSSVACTSFGQKTTNHMSGSTAPAALALLAMDSGNFTTAMSNFVTTCTNQLAGDFSNLPGDFANAISALASAVVSPSAFQGSLLSDILTPIGQIISDLVAFGGAVVTAFLDLLQSIAADLLSYLNAPLNIPVISDIFSWMTNGAPLTIMNLFSLLVAIPVTIIYKAVNGGTAPISPDALTAGYSPEVAQVFYTISMVVYGVLEGLNDVCAPLDSLNPFIWPTVFLNVAVVVSLRYTFDPDALFSPPDSTHNDLYYALSFAPFVFAVYGAVGGGAQSFATIAQWCNYATTGAGFGLLGYSIYLASAYPDTWFDPDAASVIGNVIGAVSPIDKGFSAITPQTRATLDLFSDIVSGLFNIANWGSANGLT